jgi:hypothetical protein
MGKCFDFGRLATERRQVRDFRFFPSGMMHAATGIFGTCKDPPTKGSTAINAGLDTSAIVPYDMEGNAEPSFKVVEIGAYEYTHPGGAFRVVEQQEKK